jgi:hypothetical protein
MACKAFLWAWLDKYNWEDVRIAIHPLSAWSHPALLLELEAIIRPLAKVLLIKFWNGQDARSTRKNVFCGMGILPVLVIFARGLF